MLTLLRRRSSGVPTYYVDATAGNNSNDGRSEASPWQTIAKVNSSTFQPGDQILFKRGETWNEKLIPPSSGTEANPIVFAAYGAGALPIIDAQAAREEAVMCAAGIAWTKTTFLHLKNGTGVAGGYECHGNTNIIEDCTITAHPDSNVSVAGDAHLIARRLTVTNAGDDGLTLHTTASALVEACTFTGNRTAMNNSGTAMEMTVNDCIFEDNGNGVSSSFGDVGPLSLGTFVFNRCHFKGRTDGGPFSFVNVTDVSTVTFNYCLFDDSRSISSANGSVSTSTALSTLNFNNCTFIGLAAADRGSLFESGGTTNLVNCIFYHWWRVSKSGTGVVNANYCLFHSGTTLSPTTNTNAPSTADPLFVNAAGRDFRLQSGSPARGTGTNLGLTTDLAGNPVANPPSLGAYEYVP